MPDNSWSVRKTFVVLLIVCTLAPTVVAIVRPYENWPFTSAPMFAHPAGSDVPRYRFHLIGEGPNGIRELNYYHVGANWSLMRFFFKYVYGAAEPGSIFEVYPDDTRARFEERLSLFFSAFAREYVQRPTNRAHPLERIRLEVSLLGEKNESLVRHTVGTFNVAQDKFHHEWGNE